LGRSILDAAVSPYHPSPRTIEHPSSHPAVLCRVPPSGYTPQRDGATILSERSTKESAFLDTEVRHRSYAPLQPGAPHKKLGMYVLGDDTARLLCSSRRVVPLGRERGAAHCNDPPPVRHLGAPTSAPTASASSSRCSQRSSAAGSCGLRHAVTCAGRSQRTHRRSCLAHGATARSPGTWYSTSVPLLSFWTAPTEVRAAQFHGCVRKYPKRYGTTSCPPC
jgi:hypothetical protein